MKKIFTDEQEKFMINNYLTMSYKEIGEKLGFTERQIRGRLNNMGYTKIRKINDHYFDIIDIPLKAYLLGFIYADGWVYHNENTRNYEFGIQLQSSDKYILEKINEELGGQNIIYKYEPHVSNIQGHESHSGYTDCLRIYSKNLVLGLESNGVLPNKTKKDIYPIVPDELFFDYLRGYIDGDGCYYNNKNSIYMHITCASLEPLKYIQSKLKEYDIETHIYSENEKKHRLMCTNTIEMNKLLNHLYYEDGLFCLKRKYEKIAHLLGFAA